MAFLPTSESTASLKGSRIIPSCLLPAQPSPELSIHAVFYDNIVMVAIVSLGFL